MAQPPPPDPEAQKLREWMNITQYRTANTSDLISQTADILEARWDTILLMRERMEKVQEDLSDAFWIIEGWLNPVLPDNTYNAMHSSSRPT